MNSKNTFTECSPEVCQDGLKKPQHELGQGVMIKVGTNVRSCNPRREPDPIALPVPVPVLVESQRRNPPFGWDYQSQCQLGLRKYPLLETATKATTSLCEQLAIGEPKSHLLA